MSLASKVVKLVESNIKASLSFIDPNFYLTVNRQGYFLGTDEKEVKSELKRLKITSRWGDPDKTLEAVRNEGVVAVKIGNLKGLSQLKKI